MARKQATQSKGPGRFRSAADAVKKLFTRGRGTAESGDSRDSATPRQSASRTSPTQKSSATPSGRVTRREADIPLDVLEHAYTPQDTSSKAAFRSDGSDHQKDQEFALGVADDRWNDEDRLTNKSGDPRIGTHRRTYEPAEARAESRE
jgi:hypothetical protein